MTYVNYTETTTTEQQSGVTQALALARQGRERDVPLERRVGPQKELDMPKQRWVLLFGSS